VLSVARPTRSGPHRRGLCLVVLVLDLLLGGHDLRRRLAHLDQVLLHLVHGLVQHLLRVLHAADCAARPHALASHSSATAVSAAAALRGRSQAARQQAQRRGCRTAPIAFAYERTTRTSRPNRLACKPSAPLARACGRAGACAMRRAPAGGTHPSDAGAARLQSKRPQARATALPPTPGATAAPVLTHLTVLWQALAARLQEQTVADTQSLQRTRTSQVRGAHRDSDQLAVRGAKAAACGRAGAAGRTAPRGILLCARQVGGSQRQRHAGTPEV